MLNPFPVVLIKYPDEGTLRKEEFLLAGSEGTVRGGGGSCSRIRDPQTLVLSVLSSFYST